MLVQWLLVAHVVVLGYWLGSEFVINSTYRYVSYRGDMPFAERKALMEHVLDVDQHVRYALVLQAGLGVVLALLLGYLPGGPPLAAAVAGVAVFWLGFVELVHRWRKRPQGARLAGIDRAIRYGLLMTLAIAWIGTLTGTIPLAGWLGWKLLCFGGVILCGVGIRFQIIRFFETWAVMERSGSTKALEDRIRQIYVRATSILVGLWTFIAAMVVLSVWKPGLG